MILRAITLLPKFTVIAGVVWLAASTLWSV